MDQLISTNQWGKYPALRPTGTKVPHHTSRLGQKSLQPNTNNTTDCCASPSASQVGHWDKRPVCPIYTNNTSIMQKRAPTQASPHTKRTYIRWDMDTATMLRRLPCPRNPNHVVATCSLWKQTCLSTSHSETSQVSYFTSTQRIGALRPRGQEISTQPS